MHVIKRNGVKSPVVRDKITARVRKLSYNLAVSDQVVDRIIEAAMRHMKDGIHTCEIDQLVANIMTKDPACDETLLTLAARIEASNLHKETIKRFSTVHNLIYEQGQHRPPLISKDEHDFVILHKDELDSAIISDRDFRLPYSTLIEEEETVLYRIDDKIVERPGHRYMRAAISMALAADKDATLETVLKVYDDLSLRELAGHTD